jgi:cysteine desulfurase
MNPIYLDYNATTPIAKEVASEMIPYLKEYYGNPSSSHWYGIQTQKAIYTARKRIATLINCNVNEIIFTSGGTESNNMAIKGYVFANKNKGNHIITSNIEHPAINEVCDYLENSGYKITRLPVDNYGILNPKEVSNAITKETILITIMHANNETGSIQNIENISKIAQRHHICFHTDAAQSLGKIPTDVKKMGIDMLSIAGHKIYAPKGIGALYVKEGIILEKFMHGAPHENNKRAGTENVLEIVGLGKACDIAHANFSENFKKLQYIRDLLWNELQKNIPNIKLNGHPTQRLPNTLNVIIPNIEANNFLLEIDEIAASPGAACHSDSIEVSPIILAMGVPKNIAKGSIRFSVGKYTTEEEIYKAVEIIKAAL